MQPNAWVLFDKIEGEYLTTGKTVFYEHSKNPAEAHMYLTEKIAHQRANILIDGFHQSKQYFKKKKCELQIVPIVVAPQKAIDFVYSAKTRKQGYGVYVVHEWLYKGKWEVSEEGFWKKPPYVSMTSNEFRGTLNADGQKGTSWSSPATAQKWADAMKQKEVNTRNRRTKITVRVV